MSRCGPKAMDLVYSETAGSSRGVRFYLRYLCRPNEALKVTQSRFESPRVTAYWDNGEHLATNLHGMNPHQVAAVIDLHMNSQGSNIFLRHGGPRVWSTNPSIQGLWKPTLESSINALRPFHQPVTETQAGNGPSRGSRDTLRFSGDLLKLSKAFVRNKSSRQVSR